MARFNIRALSFSVVLMASVCFAAATVANQSLDWRQRYLGILPLVKLDPADPMIATVDGTQVTLAQVNSFAKTEARMLHATSTQETRIVLKDALDSLVGRALLLHEAERRKVTIPDAEVAQRAREFQLTDASGGIQQQSGAPDQLLLTEVRESMEIEKMLDDEFKKHHVSPSDKDIVSYYNAHKDLFTSDPGEVKISHIAVKLPPNPTDEQKKAAEKKVAELYRKAEKTSDFAKLARENSEDPISAPKGGDLGYFRPGQLPPVVEKEAFKTPVGKLSDVIASNIGLSFMKITDRRGATYLPLKDVRAKIAMVVQAYNEDDIVKDMVLKLKKKAKIQMHELPKPTTSS